MKGVGPGVLDKPLEDDPRFEQLPTTVCTEDFLDLSGGPMSFQSQEDMEPYLHDGICPTRRRDWTSLEEAMERENQAKQQGSRQASTERYKPVEYMSQLALKRGAKMRGDTRGLDYKSGAVTAVLLSHNPDFRYFYNNDAEELADHLHWFDELAGPSGMALLPGLDRHQLFNFVDQRKFKESVVTFLQNRKEKRKQRALAANSCTQRASKTGRPMSAAALRTQQSAAGASPSQPGAHATPPGRPASAGTERSAPQARPSTAGAARLATATPKESIPPRRPATALPPKAPKPGQNKLSTAEQAEASALLTARPSTAGAGRATSAAASSTPPAAPTRTADSGQLGPSSSGRREAAVRSSSRASSAAARHVGREGDGGAEPRAATPDNAPRYSAMKRFAKQMKAGSRTAGMKTRLDRTEKELHQHLKAIRPQTAPARTGSLTRASSTDWDAVLGQDDPQMDAVHVRAYRMQPGAAAWRLEPRTGPVHPMSASDLRAVWRTTRATSAARIPRRMEAADPSAIETCRGPPRRGRLQEQLSATRFFQERPPTAPLQEHIGDAGPGGPLDAAMTDISELCGRPTRTMTLHHRAPRQIDGSLTANDPRSEQRWQQKVADELESMVQRLDRMHAVYDSCRATPHHTHVYEALEATADPLQPAPRQLMACASDATAKARAASARRSVAWAPGVRGDEIKLSHTAISTAQVAALIMLLTRPQYEASAAALRSLALAGNALTDQHVSMLLEGLQGLLQIERVDLSLNRLTRVAAGALARTIVEGQAKHLAVLDLSGNNLAGPGMVELFEALPLTAMRRLRLSNCGLDSAACRGLAFFLDNTLALEHLDVGWNRLDAADMHIIAEALRFNQSVHSIELQHNALGADGGAALGEALYDNRTLRFVGLASNRITMHACTVLAAGMRVSRALDRLVLDDNPIGLTGGVAIAEALARGYVRCVTLTNCNFSNSGLALQRAAAPSPPVAAPGGAVPGAPAPASTGPASFDVKRPNRVYRLQLAHVADYNVAGTLVQYWAHDTTAGGPWKSATLDGKVLHLTAQMQWPQRMPREGLLEVDFRTAQLVADTRVPVLDEQFDNLHRPTLSAAADVTDAFRSAFCQVLAHAVYVTCAQATRALQGFSARSEQVRAALAMLAALEDPVHLPRVIESLSPEAQQQVRWRLGPLRGFSPANPTGSYVLNLSQAVDLSLAARLLTCWGVQIRQGLCKPAELQACWRNVYLDGAFIDTLQLDPLLYDLPRSGVLRLDFVSYDTPSLRHADLLCRLQTLRARLFRVKPPAMIAAAAAAAQPRDTTASMPSTPSTPQPSTSGVRQTQQSVVLGAKIPHASVKFTMAPESVGDGVGSPTGQGSFMGGGEGLTSTRNTRSSTRASVGKRHGGRKRGQQAEEAAEPAADERERLHREAAATHAGRVLATLDADVQVAECASTLRLAGLLQELQAAVEATRERFHSLAREDRAAEAWTVEDLSKKLAADTATRAALNTNHLGHHRPALLTPVHMHALLALLALPRVMPPGDALALFREISSGNRGSSAEAVKDALRPFAQPPPREARTESAEEVALLQSVLAQADAAEAEAAADAAAAGGDSDAGSMAVRASAAVSEAPTEVKRKGKGKKGRKGATGADEEEPVFPPGPRMGIAAGNAAEALEVLRELAVDYYCTAEQVDLLAELFDDIPHKVRVVQMFWARVLNRARLPHLLRCVPRDAQVALGHRLGWKTVVNLAQPDGAYELDLSRPDDNDAGARLFRAAVDIRGRCVNNLLIDGKPHIIKEENFLLFGVVEEKALKTASKRITFDFWSARQNVLQDRRFNAALLLQQAWRALRERRRRRSSARARSAARSLRLASGLRSGAPLSPAAGEPRSPAAASPLPSSAAAPALRAAVVEPDLQTAPGPTEAALAPSEAPPAIAAAGVSDEWQGESMVGTPSDTGASGRAVRSTAGGVCGEASTDSSLHLDLPPRGGLSQCASSEDAGVGLLLSPLDGAAGGGDGAV